MSTEHKRARLLEALDQGMVMVHLDATHAGTVVPAQLAKEAHLRLNLSYRFDPPDLTVDDLGVQSTLSFSGERFRVVIPWGALFAITSYVTRQFWLYEASVPTLIRNPPPAEDQPEPAQVARRGSHLRLVKS